MKKLITLIYTDLKLIFRDHTLVFFMLMPVLLILLVRYFVPYHTIQFPVVAEYHTLIMASGSLQTAIMFGFITSFIILDEKDENVLQVIKVLPISSLYFITYRLTFAGIFSAIGAFLMINLGGIAHPGFFNSIVLSIQYGLAAPLITLIIATYANNKVEGMALFKGVDLVLILPLLSFFIVGNLKYLLAIIPVFWTYNFYQQTMAGESTWWIFICGIIVYAIVLTVLFQQFKTRVFNR
jgi:fluoroquinolone transport system permease protein